MEFPLALVTGAGRGIGAALAERLAQEGHTVIAADLHAPDDRAVGAGRILGHTLDVTDREAYAALVEQITSTHGPIELLVNNAGIGVGGEVRDMNPGDWSRILDVNVLGVVHGIDAVYPSMVQRGRGHIVNVASLAGLVPLPGQAPYCASKFAVVGLTGALRAEAAGLGVDVTLLCPGVVATDIYADSPLRGFEKDGVLSLWPDGMSAAACADQMMKAIRDRRRVSVITRHARWLSRAQAIAPGFMAWASTHYMRRMRRFREVV